MLRRGCPLRFLTLTNPHILTSSLLPTCTTRRYTVLAQLYKGTITRRAPCWDYRQAKRHFRSVQSRHLVSTCWHAWVGRCSECNVQKDLNVSTCASGARRNVAEYSRSCAIKSSDARSASSGTCSRSCTTGGTWGVGRGTWDVGTMWRGREGESRVGLRDV